MKDLSSLDQLSGTESIFQKYAFSSDFRSLARISEFAGATATTLAVPPHFLEILLLLEDKRFPSHHGLDPFGMLRAVRSNLTGGRYRQGASTIPQQLYGIRIAQRTGSYRRTLTRKLIQIPFGIWISSQMTKVEILGEYLNTVYWGGAIYGLDAATRSFFNKGRNSLSVQESFYLAERLACPNRRCETRLGVILRRPSVALFLERHAVDFDSVKAVYGVVPSKAGKPLSQVKPSPIAAATEADPLRG